MDSDAWYEGVLKDVIQRLNSVLKEEHAACPPLVTHSDKPNVGINNHTLEFLLEFMKDLGVPSESVDASAHRTLLISLARHLGRWISIEVPSLFASIQNGVYRKEYKERATHPEARQEEPSEGDTPRGARRAGESTGAHDDDADKCPVCLADLLESCDCAVLPC